jgi:transposase
LEAAVIASHRDNEASRRLASIPGVGPITASAIVASVAEAHQFKSARHFAAWLGLTPRSHSTGGKERLGGISKQGDPYLRRLLVTGATCVIRYARRKAPGEGGWVEALLARRPARLVSVALANKMARIVWALLVRGSTYRRPAPPWQQPDRHRGTGAPTVARARLKVMAKRSNRGRGEAAPPMTCGPSAAMSIARRVNPSQR